MEFTLTLISIEGSVKTIAAVDITRDMAADAIWYNSNASPVTSVPYDLKIEDREWVVWEQGEYVEVKFTPDGNLDDGQGFGSVPYGTQWKVVDVSGDVYIVRRKYLTAGDSLADIYSNAERAAAQVNDTLKYGDAILCAKGNAYFTVQVTAALRCGYASIPFVQAAN